MDAKFEWFGFSVARKHIYFYTLLILCSIFANGMKEQLLPTDSAEMQAKSFDLRQLAERVASGDNAPSY
jgi:hypothetical protein